MTKKEIAEIIESKAAAYGFAMQENTMGWANESDRDTCIRIEIRKETDYEKTDWEAREVFRDIKANASICQMGGGTFESRRRDCAGREIHSRHQQHGAFLHRNLLS